jgi:hypothetical protein
MSGEAMTGRLGRLPDSYDSRNRNLETLSMACSLLCWQKHWKDALLTYQQAQAQIAQIPQIPNNITSDDAALQAWRDWISAGISSGARATADEREEVRIA